MDARPYSVNMHFKTPRKLRKETACSLQEKFLPMFDTLVPMPADPILGISLLCKADPNPAKIDLGVGIYKDDGGKTPVMRAVKMAENLWHHEEASKTYVGVTGNAAFNASMLSMMLADTPGQELWATAQGAGGSGALRVGAEIIKLANPEAAVWVPTPTWGNHIPLIGTAGLEIKAYPYYSKETLDVEFDAMCEALKNDTKPGDIILLHGCCHNPTGADLESYQWDVLAELLPQAGLIPFVDLAYFGMGEGLDADCYGLRKLAATQEEMILAASCSKNFGLYRERTGLVAVKTKTEDAAKVAKGHLGLITRKMISMPPDHGAALVARILSDDNLMKIWREELEEMRLRMKDLRSGLASALSVQGAENMAEALARQNGMFSMLPITKEQAGRLRSEHSVYLLDSGRLNIAGASTENIDRLAGAVLAVL